jgi:ADP-ribosyl-[dinitrogen reductase] hydrolase
MKPQASDSTPCPTQRADALAGVILGTAVGDALGLPREMLSARRAERLFGGSPLRYRFVLGRGMVSDDTQHTCMVAQALLASGGDPVRFMRSFAWRLRGWLLGLPAGVGLSTLKAILKLLIGFPPSHSGVWSAGNGPAMRAAILGVYSAHDFDRLRELVRASTRLTHTDPDAEYGALAVAMAAAHGMSRGPTAVNATEFLACLQKAIPPGRLTKALDPIPEHLARGAMPVDYARALGLEGRISGYINHTVPVALYCWLRWPDDFRTAVEQVILLGGDTDTTGAIVGAIAGATFGVGGIPQEWIKGLAEWPRSVKWMRALAARLSETVTGRTQKPLPVFLPGVFARNLLFLVVVLSHGFRRLAPPY